MLHQFAFYCILGIPLVLVSPCVGGADRCSYYVLPPITEHTSAQRVRFGSVGLVLLRCVPLGILVRLCEYRKIEGGWTGNHPIPFPHCRGRYCYGCNDYPTCIAPGIGSNCHTRTGAVWRVRVVGSGGRSGGGVSLLHWRSALGLFRVCLCSDFPDLVHLLKRFCSRCLPCLPSWPILRSCPH